MTGVSRCRETKVRKHVRILCWSTCTGPIHLKVIYKCGCVVTEITKINGLAALSEEQQPVEHLRNRDSASVGWNPEHTNLEQLGRRLGSVKVSI